MKINLTLLICIDYNMKELIIVNSTNWPLNNTTEEIDIVNFHVGYKQQILDPHLI